MTGEINLEGKIMSIGGLDCKIKGGVRAGITEFIYPKENEREFKQFLDKNKDITKNITFHAVSNIYEVLKIIFVK